MLATVVVIVPILDSIEKLLNIDKLIQYIIIVTKRIPKTIFDKKF